jgi:hypothetical protein
MMSQKIVLVMQILEPPHQMMKNSKKMAAKQRAYIFVGPSQFIK